MYQPCLEEFYTLFLKKINFSLTKAFKIALFLGHKNKTIHTLIKKVLSNFFPPFIFNNILQQEVNRKANIYFKI